MKTNPFKGIYHSNIRRAFKGNDLIFYVAVRHEYSSATSLVVSVITREGKSSFTSMLTDETSNAKIFSFRIPHDVFDGVSFFDYEITDGIFTVFGGEVSVIEEPNFPPLAITEIYSRPRRGKITSRYVELTNPSNENADLYDYKITREVSGKNLSSFLESNKGDSIISPKETVVLRFLVPQSFDADGNISESTEEYLRGIYDENIYGKNEYKPARVIDVDTTCINPSTGVREIAPGEFQLGPEQSPTKIYLSERDGDNVIFTLNLNETPETLDVLTTRCALFAPDVEKCAVGRCIRRNADQNPGVFDERIPLPDVKNSVSPLIIPIFPMSKHLMSEGEVEICYTVYGNCADSYVVLYINDGEKVIYPEKEGSTYKAVIPYDIVKTNKELRCSVIADNGAYFSSFGSKDEPAVYPMVDNVGPELSMISPKPYFAYDGETNPRITGSLSDVSGVNIPACRIMLDSEDYTEHVTWNGATFVFTPAKPLKYGEHKLKVTAYDMLGNSSVFSVRFSVAKYDDMNLYLGEVHTHTAESDGMGTPTEAMLHARDEAGMDFFAVTEHSTYLIDDKYKNQIKIANEMNDPGRFAALYGWEMTWAHANGLWGHMNLIGCPDVILNRDDYSLGMFYEWIEKHGGIAMFNHPGFSWGNFEEYKISSEITNKYAALAEIKGTGYDREYSHMLKKGYRVSPVYNEDNHSGTWGTANDWYAYALAPYLSRENILDAFRKRRTYSTYDRTLKLKYSVNGKWMGSEIDYTDELSVKVSVSTENEYGIGNIQLLSVNGMVIAEINAGLRREYTWELKIPTEYPYYYVRINGQHRYTVSAPVWINTNNKLKLEEVLLLSSYNEELPAVFKASVRNNADEILKNVKADIYISPVSGIRPNDLPYTTVFVGKLKVGEKIDISRKVPVVPQNRVLTVILSGEGKNAKFFDNDSIFLSQLQIAEVLPLSAPTVLKNDEGEEVIVKNPFPYVKLYNSSPKEISLSAVKNGACLRLWNKAGKAPVDGQHFTFENATIMPHSSVIVWKRNTPELTAEDFNRRYGTLLIEGETLFITDRAIIRSDSGYKRIDLLYAGEIISRVHYNYCLESLENEIEEDKAFNYKYVPNYTGTSEMLTSATKPNPAGIYQEQIPTSIIGGAKEREIKAEKKAVKAEKLKKQNDGKGGVGIPVIGGIAAAGATVGTILGATVKAAKAPTPSAQAKADAKLIASAQKKATKKANAADAKLIKASEKRMVKAISSNINNTIYKKYNQRAVGMIDDRIKSDKDSIKSAQKNLKVLKMKKKAEKAAAKREKEIQKAQNS